jgi:hypothetical protein
LLKNHHAFESKVQEAQEAQVVQVVQVAQVARANQVARERPDGLRAALQEALALKAHAEKNADLKAVLRTALQEALALKDQAEEDQAEEDQAEKDQAEKECGVRIPNDSSSGPWNSIVMAMASSIATS